MRIITDIKNLAKDDIEFCDVCETPITYRADVFVELELFKKFTIYLNLCKKHYKQLKKELR